MSHIGRMKSQRFMICRSVLRQKLKMESIFYAPEWRDKITEVFTACAQKGIPYDEEMEIISSKGKRKWIRTIGEAVRDETGRIYEVNGSFQDITEKKAVEKALLDSEENLRVTLHSIGDAVIATDTEGKITNMNPVAENLCGWAF